MRVFCTDLVSIMFRFKRAVFRDAKISRLIASQLIQSCSQSTQMKLGHLLVQMLRKHIDADRILIFSSMFSLAYYVDGLGPDESWADNLNFTPELEQINIPALLLWGRNDGAVPAAVGNYVYDHLATDVSRKELVKIDECSHAPHYDQPEIFYQEVREFVERYK